MQNLRLALRALTKPPLVAAIVIITFALADLTMPGVFPVAGSALVLLTAAVLASILPAARAARRRYSSMRSE